MDLNAILLTSWDRLRELLQYSECIGRTYLPAATACVTLTSDAHIRERTAYFKRKHRLSRLAVVDVRSGVIIKDMNTHAKAIYTAWESLATLQAEYDAIMAVKKHWNDAVVDRENATRRRMQLKEETAAKNRAITREMLDKRGVDLGSDAEDAADAIEDEKADRKAQRARAKEEAEQKEAEKRSAIRAHVLTSYTIEQVSKLLPILNNLTSREAEAFLRTVRSEKPGVHPPPSSFVQPAAPQPAAPQPPAPQPRSILNSMLDHDDYDINSPPKTPVEKKNKNRDSSGSESESDIVVRLPDSPSKQQRINDLSSSMSSVNLAAAEGA